MNIKIYGADWCSDCLVAKRFLDEKGVKYDYLLLLIMMMQLPFWKR